MIILENDRISVPGPSDSYLEALLYFDSSTYSKLLQQRRKYPESNSILSKNIFNFDWLKEDIKKELNSTGVDSISYKSGISVFDSEEIFLKNKILLKYVRN